jgi:hypothetical protein
MPTKGQNNPVLLYDIIGVLAYPYNLIGLEGAKNKTSICNPEI